MHDTGITMVLNAPINLFFDITPIGKILNRFSKDLAIVDEKLCYNYGSFLSCFYYALSALLVASVAVPWIMVVIAVFLFFGLWLFNYSMKAYKDCYRIETVAWSPVLSFFKETISGNTVIRAFGKEKEFLEHSNYLINRATIANQITNGVFGWYSMRLDLLSSTILAAGCVASILLRDQVNPVLLSLMLQYLLTLQLYCQWCLHNFGEIERKMVSVQRLYQLEDIP